MGDRALKIGRSSDAAPKVAADALIYQDLTRRQMDKNVLEELGRA